MHSKYVRYLPYEKQMLFYSHGGLSGGLTSSLHPLIGLISYLIAIPIACFCTASSQEKFLRLSKHLNIYISPLDNLSQSAACLLATTLPLGSFLKNVGKHDLLYRSSSLSSEFGIVM